MADEKKIKFGGEASSFLNELNKANQKVKEYYSEQLSNALKLSNSTKQQNEYIRLQTKATEDRVNALRKEQEALIQNFNLEKQRIQAQQRAGTLTQQQAQQQIKSASSTLTQNLNERDVRIKDLDKVIELLRSTKDEISLAAMKEISENKKGVIEQVKEFQKAQQKGDDYLAQKYTPEQIMKLQRQKNILSSEGEVKPKQQSVFGAILGAEMIKAAIQKVNQIGATFSGGQSGEQLVADILKTVPAVGGIIGGAVGRHQEELFQAQTAERRLKGRTGQGGMFSFSNMGFSIAETMPVAEQAATALGTGSNIRGNTRDVIAAERSFSLERGLLIDMLKSQRMQTDGDLNKNISTVYNTMKTRGFISDKDSTQFQEILQLQNQLLNQQSEVMENVDANMNTGVIAAFRGVGGSFADARAGQRISQISGALSQPGNDFQRARNMQVLSGINPGASFFETLEMQEKGIVQEGFLSETLKQLEKETGGGEAMMMATMSRFGLNAGTTRKLVDSFQADRSRFDRFGGTEGELMKELDLVTKATGMTADREQSQARISDAFVGGSLKGLKQAGVEFGKEAAEFIKESGLPFGEAAANAILSVIRGEDKAATKKKMDKQESMIKTQGGYGVDKRPKEIIVTEEYIEKLKNGEKSE